MQSLQALRDYIVRCVPFLRENPEKLSVFAKDGQIFCSGNGSLSHQPEYMAHVFVEDWAGDLSSILIPVLHWIRTFSPELMMHGRGDVKFDAELTSRSTADIKISFKISDSVIVSKTSENAWSVRYPQKRVTPFESTTSEELKLYDKDGQLLVTLTDPGSGY